MDDLSLSSNSIHKILIFDDLAMTLGDDQRVADLTVFSARKANLSINYNFTKYFSKLQVWVRENGINAKNM